MGELNEKRCKKSTFEKSGAKRGVYGRSLRDPWRTKLFLFASLNALKKVDFQRLGGAKQIRGVFKPPCGAKQIWGFTGARREPPC